MTDAPEEIRPVAFCSTHIDEHPHVRREAGSIVPWAAAMRNNDDQGWSPVR